MSQNFKDYEASYITPQKTLLKKLNEILKFLEQSEISTTLYKHTLQAGPYYITWVDNDSTVFKTYNSDVANSIKKALSGFYFGHKIIDAEYTNSKLRLSFVSSSDGTTIQVANLNASDLITSQCKTEEY